MKKFVLSFLLSLPLWAAPPDCSYTYRFTNRTGEPTDGVIVYSGATSTLPINNQNGCVGWQLSYSSEGFTVVSLNLQQAPKVWAGGLVFSSGSWSTFSATSGTTAIGTLPLSSTSGDTYIGVGFYPYIRVNLATATGTGSIDIQLSGWKSSTYLSGTGGGSGGSSGSLASTSTILAAYNLSQTTCSTGTVIPDVSGNGRNAVVVGTLTCPDGTGFTGWSTSNYLSLSSGTAVTYSAVKTVEAYVDDTYIIQLNSVAASPVVGSSGASDVFFSTSSHYPITGETAAFSANAFLTTYVGTAITAQTQEQLPNGPHFFAWQLGTGSYYANDQGYVDGIPSQFSKAAGASAALSRVGTATIGYSATGPFALGSTYKVFYVILRSAQVPDSAIYQDYVYTKNVITNRGVSLEFATPQGYTGTTVTIVGDSTSWYQSGETGSWPSTLVYSDPNNVRTIISATPGMSAVNLSGLYDRSIKAFKAPQGRNILVYKMGINDIAGSNFVATADLHWYIWMLPWIQQRVADGYTVIVPTMTACGSTATGTCETARAEMNSLIFQHANSTGYKVVDVHADPRLATYTDTNYFLSGGSTEALHLTDAGNLLLSKYMSNGINGLYTVKDYATQTITGSSNYSFTDADYWIKCNSSGTISLPYPTAKTGEKRIIQNIRAGTCAVNVLAAPTSTTSPITTTVNGTSSYSIPATTTVIFVADPDGANWSIQQAS